MRSGTTFLANFLNSQEKLTVYADMLVSLFMEAHSLGIHDIHRKLSEREKNVLMSNIIQEGKLHHLDFSVIDREAQLSWFRLFEKALGVIKEDEDTLLVGVKRTREEKYLSQLLEAGVKVIYCVRDPRDVITSARHRFAKFDLFKFLNNWKLSVKLALQLDSYENFLLLKYEDLILEKENTAILLEQFLGQSVTTQLEKFNFGHSMHYRDNSSFGDVNKLFDPKAVNRWKSNEGNPEAIFVEKLLDDEIKYLRYESSQPPIHLVKSIEVKRLIKAHKRWKKKEWTVHQLKKILRN